MAIPRSHHYVPAFYLEGFADPLASKQGTKPILWVYERGREIRKSSPHNEGHERDFYAYEADGRMHHDLEFALSQVESIAAPILKRLGDEGFSFAHLDKRNVSSFVAVMFLRGPAGRTLLEKSAESSIRTIAQRNVKDGEKFEAAYEKFKEGSDVKVSREEIQDFVLGDAFRVKIPRIRLLSLMKECMLHVGGRLAEMNCQIWHSDGRESFLTSDNPVFSVLRQSDDKVSIGWGLALPGVEVFFPVSARTCLRFGGRVRDGLEMVQARSVRTVNRMTMISARRFVYAPWRSAKTVKLFDKIGGRIRYDRDVFQLPHVFD